MTARRQERGFALVLVLWVVAALSLIAGAMLAASMTSARIERNSWAQIEVRTAADSAVQEAILSLFDPGHPVPLDGRVRDIAAGDMSIALAIQDQRGLIDLNEAGPGLLGTLLRVNGIDKDEADKLADRIIDWRSPAGAQHLNGASSADYGDAGYAYRPRNAPFQSLDELRLVMGMTPEIYAQIAPALTVFSHRADFDMRVAPGEVLRVIPGMNQVQIDLAVASRVSAFARPGHAFAIAAKVQKDQVQFTRRAVVLLTGDPDRPYRILDWQ